MSLLHLHVPGVFGACLRIPNKHADRLKESPVIIGNGYARGASYL